MYCTWPRSNRRIMEHIKILSERFFTNMNGNLNKDDKKSTWILLNKLNKRLELLSVTQNYTPREIWDMSYEIATLH
jgi:hypothetical protein